MQVLKGRVSFYTDLQFVDRIGLGLAWIGKDVGCGERGPRDLEYK